MIYIHVPSPYFKPLSNHRSQLSFSSCRDFGYFGVLENLSGLAKVLLFDDQPRFSGLWKVVVTYRANWCIVICEGYHNCSNDSSQHHVEQWCQLYCIHRHSQRDSPVSCLLLISNLSQVNLCYLVQLNIWNVQLSL